MTRRMFMCSLVSGVSLVSALLPLQMPASAASPTTNLAARQIPGTTPSTWTPFKVCRHRCPPGPVTEAYSLGRYATQQVQVMEFPTDRAASKIYARPASLARFEEEPVSVTAIAGGVGPVSSPSQWLSMRICVEPQGTTSTTDSGTGLPGPPAGAPVGAPTASGHCSRGVPSVNGIAVLARRGRVLLLVQADGIGSDGPFTLQQAGTVTAITDNVTLTKSVLSMIERRR
jgi:hypothetical protein